MTNRYPLIVNTATSQITELPAGDNLDLSSSNISNVGNITVASSVNASNVVVSTSVTSPTIVVDGLDVGTKLIPLNSKSTNYTLIISDSGKAIFHPSTDASSRNFTLPADSSVPFQLGTAITFINRGGAVSIQITTDTLIFAGDGSTGTRTLATNGIATAIKLTATEWIISGVGLS